MIRTLGGLAATVVLMLSVVASPAHAADELGLSSDGQNWSDHLSGPLFDDPVLWVPGDVEEVKFFVRNQADNGGTLTIAVETENQQQLLREDRIQLSARVGSDPWVDLAPCGQAIRLNDAVLPANSVREVKVNARFDFGSGNDSQTLMAKLRFRVTLSGADSTRDPDGPSGTQDPDGSQGPGGLDGDQGPKHSTDLPNAGAPAVGWFIVASGVALGIGIALMRRRHGEEDRHG